MFSWKKAKKLLKILLLSLFIERVFCSCEDMVCTCDSLADPSSIETFDNGIILVFEMIVCLNNPPSMKRFQITQFEGYFNIARYNSVWQLFANSIRIPSVELVWDKFLCWLIDAKIQRLELVREIVWNDNQLTVIICTYSSLSNRRTSRQLIFWEFFTHNSVIWATTFIKNSPNSVVQLPTTPLFQPPHHLKLEDVFDFHYAHGKINLSSVKWL